MKTLVLICIALVTFSFNANAHSVHPKKSSSYLNSMTENLVYPETAKANNEEGVVYVAFTISENSQPENVEVLQGVSSSLDNAATEFVKNMSAEQVKENNFKVGTTYIIPVKFEIL